MNDKITLTEENKKEIIIKVAETINKIDKYNDVKFECALCYCFSIINHQLKKAKTSNDNIGISQLNKLLKPILEIIKVLDEDDPNPNNPKSITNLLNL
jgi:hypothetical protein